MAETARGHPTTGFRPTAADTDLQTAVRRTAAVRRCFYAVVLVVALVGQVSGATHALNIPAVWAVPAVAALELGGIVILADADVRRRLGERAIASRLLSAAIAAWAVTFNWLTHPHRLEGGFFAVMSALGYAVWLIHAENQRRDRLRTTGDLPPTAPAYELLGHWLRQPRLTLHARALAKANPGLGLYGSLTAAHDEIRRRHRHRAIAAVLRGKIRSAVDRDTANIAVAVYDLDQFAARLAATADYDTLTAIISIGLTPDRLIHRAATTAQPNAPDQDPATSRSTAKQPLSTTTAQATSEPTAPGLDRTPPATNEPKPGTYQPTNHEDAVMYETWLHHHAAGKEPSGADLARAAGRPHDASGAGRRAARRYRQAHTRETIPEPRKFGAKRARLPAKINDA